MGPARQERERGSKIRVRRRFAGAYAAEEGVWGWMRGIEMKLGSRRTCPYPWLAVGWPELLAVKLTSCGGGRDSPEWKKTMARGGSWGSAASRQHQGTSNAMPEQLVELKRHRSKVAELRSSPEFSGASPGGEWRQ